MRLVTPTGDEMIEVRTIDTKGSNLVLGVTVMRSMQMSVVLTPTEIRKGLRLLSFKLMVKMVSMLFRR